MEFSELVNLIVNNSAIIGCLIYFMYRDWKFMNLTLAKLAVSDELQNEVLNKTK